MATLAQIKQTVRPGQIYDVTNHYITRQDHPAYGTTRRTVSRTTGKRIYLTRAGHRGETGVDWPRAAQVQRDPDGTIRLYGGGIGQEPEELFLTLVPVPGFTLDGAYAASWLTRAARTEVIEDGLPDITAGWRPASQRGGTVAELLDTAEAAGVLRCPPGWRIRCIHGDTGSDSHQWLLVSTGPARPQALPGPLTSPWPDGTGAEVALELLRQAVAAGNQLLAMLDSPAGTGQAPATGPGAGTLPAPDTA